MKGSLHTLLLVATAATTGHAFAPRALVTPPTASSSSLAAEKKIPDGWVGGFREANPEMSYPQLTPNLSSLPIEGNLANIDKLRSATAVIVVAGMDGALPSVVGGIVSAPVIAVPTSTGYGASFEGLSALLSMLNSCAPGVSVVNIDNGFGAAAAAMRIQQP